jgi:quinol-cytochrome oxidoreductase complex cytochrome b subunit
MADAQGPKKEPTLIQTYLQEVQRLDTEARAKKRFRNVEGFPFWPHEMVRNFAFICFFTAIMFGLSGFIPYYLESPADPSGQPQVILPDWYLLWSYGLLKIAVDVELFGATLLTAKVVGVLLNAVVLAPLFLVPFLAHQHSRRPVADPFWGAVGMLGVGFAITLSVASIDSLFYVEWPFLSFQYFGWSVLYWLSLFTPIAMFFLTYFGMKRRMGKTDGQTGYENKLSDNYFKIR